MFYPGSPDVDSFDQRQGRPEGKQSTPSPRRTRCCRAPAALCRGQLVRRLMSPHGPHDLFGNTGHVCANLTANPVSIGAGLRLRRHRSTGRTSGVVHTDTFDTCGCTHTHACTHARERGQGIVGGGLRRRLQYVSESAGVCSECIVLRQISDGQHPSGRRQNRLT